LKTTGDTPLFDAFELDNAPGFERFFFVVSTTEFAVSDMLEKGYDLAENRSNVLTAPLDIGSAYRQVSFTLIKEESR
jgi:hypothetical protein